MHKSTMTIEWALGTMEGLALKAAVDGAEIHAAHEKGDLILCELIAVLAAGHAQEEAIEAIVETWRAMPKWYS